MKNKQKIIIITGPTAVGKTSLAVSLAKEFKGEIISADSLQIYKGLNIGSAKVTKREMRGVPHHLIDIIAADKNYTVSDFVKNARLKIDDIIKRKKVPFIVGGTGLYINSLLFPYSFGGTKGDEEFRKKYQSIAEEKGNEHIYNMLKEVDPGAAAKLHPNQIKQVIRALEIFYLTGKPKPQTGTEDKESLYDYLLVCLSHNREELYNSINKRVDTMCDIGLIKEVQKLKKKKLNKNNQSMQGIGYKELLDYLEGKTTKEEAIELIKQHSRNYAKRQFTWFKKMENAYWFNVSENNTKSQISDKITAFLKV